MVSCAAEVVDSLTYTIPIVHRRPSRLVRDLTTSSRVPALAPDKVTPRLPVDTVGTAVKIGVSRGRGSIAPPTILKVVSP